MQPFHFLNLAILIFTSQAGATRSYKTLEEELPSGSLGYTLVDCPVIDEIDLGFKFTPVTPHEWQAQMAVPPEDGPPTLIGVYHGYRYPWCSYIGSSEFPDGNRRQVVIQKPTGSSSKKFRRAWDEQKENQAKMGRLIRVVNRDDGEWIVLNYQGVPLQLTQPYYENVKNGNVDRPYQNCKATVERIQRDVQRAMVQKLILPDNRVLHVLYKPTKMFHKYPRGESIPPGDILFHGVFNHLPVPLNCVKPACFIWDPTEIEPIELAFDKNDKAAKKAYKAKGERLKEIKKELEAARNPSRVKRSRMLIEARWPVNDIKMGPDVFFSFGLCQQYLFGVFRTDGSALVP